MPLQIVNGATLQCSFGTTPSTLVIPPTKQVGTGSTAAASVLDHIPFTNITPFGLCTTVTNPQVATATSAAMGTLTPQPCIPVIPQPWTPGSPRVAIRNQAALHNLSTCMCQWGGVITITDPGQTIVTVP
jgi:hypothetical protein